MNQTDYSPGSIINCYIIDPQTENFILKLIIKNMESGKLIYSFLNKTITQLAPFNIVNVKLLIFINLKYRVLVSFLIIHSCQR